MPDIHDMLDEQVQTIIAANTEPITALILREFFDMDALAMLSAMEAGPGEYQIEGVPMPGAQVRVTVRELATNRTAEIVLPPTTDEALPRG